MIAGSAIRNICVMRNKEPIRADDRNNTLEKDFIRIFRQHEYKLHTLALRLTKSDQYAKDIIQEVFLSLWDHRERPSQQHSERRSLALPRHRK